MARPATPQQEEELDIPPFRPPPPEREEVPQKIMTLKERMSKFQSKVASPPPTPAKVYILVL